MNYKEYDIGSFLKDEEFKKWVLTPDDSNTKFWQEFLKAHPEQRTNSQIAQQIIISLEFDEYVEKDEDKQDMLQKIYLGAKSDRGLKFAKKKLHRNNKISDIYKIAASLVLVASLSLLWVSNFQKPAVEETVASTVLKENPRGRKSIVQLPDGSVVRLNSESRITYPEHFAQHERVVHLVGEAFFEVIENKESPFSVVTGNINTTALGTSFNIQAWQDESTINISLAEGKVSVSQIGSSNEQAYYLNPGDKIIHEKNSNVFTMTKFDILEELGWKDGILVFNKANFSDVINRISRWYDVEFEVIGSHDESWSFDGRFINESLKEVLETISYTYKIDYKIVNKEVILHL